MALTRFNPFDKPWGLLEASFHEASLLEDQPPRGQPPRRNLEGGFLEASLPEGSPLEASIPRLSYVLGWLHLESFVVLRVCPLLLLVVCCGCALLSFLSYLMGVLSTSSLVVVGGCVPCSFRSWLVCVPSSLCCMVLECYCL